ncbi:Fe-S cluster assembly protein SufD [Psychromonas sp.]|uniref:Fe-S cluster assembly protein SufD n=1 Tax=Psychromonas sp. TaxID=1884585 RepID=UPI0035637926
MNACDRLLEQYKQSKEQLPGHLLPWLRTMRESAAERFATLDFPGAKDENWKYTNLKQLQKTEFQLAQAQPATNISTLPLSIKRCADNEHLLVFINGVYNPHLSNIAGLPEGFILCSFAQAVKDHPQLLAGALGKVNNEPSPLFSALNTALMSDGVFLSVPENTHINSPVHCLFISSPATEAEICNSRLLLLLNKNSRLTLLEHYMDLAVPDAEITIAETKRRQNLINVVTEIALGRQAHLNHYKLQDHSLNSSHIAAMYVQQQQESVFTSHSYSLGAALARHDIQVQLSEPQAECSLNGVYLVDGHQHVDYHTQIEHLAPNCSSQQIYKGVIQNQSRAVFDGKVNIQPIAQRSAARQINKNLLLGEQAEVDTKPELQIYADDVVCSHGATVGQLDAQSLFYLQSRGISEKDAQAWLVYGFIREVLERIDNSSMGEFIQLPVMAKLNQLVGNDISTLLAPERGEQ